MFFNRLLKFTQLIYDEEIGYLVSEKALSRIPWLAANSGNHPPAQARNY